MEKVSDHEILQVMRATGCSRRKARRALIDAFREVREAEVSLIDALRKGQVSARGFNTQTGKQEDIPRDYWSSVS